MVGSGRDVGRPGNFPGSESARGIRDELDRADFTLLLVSPGLVASEYCYSQMGTAFSRASAFEPMSCASTTISTCSIARRSRLSGYSA